MDAELADHGDVYPGEWATPEAISAGEQLTERARVILQYIFTYTELLRAKEAHAKSKQRASKALIVEDDLIALDKYVRELDKA